MKTKKLVYLFVMLCLVMVTIVTTPAKVKAMGGCSGDDCGCYADEPACIAECPPVGDPNHQPCVSACVHAAVRCAICCCTYC